MLNLPEKVEIMEVCPRDGWQNHKTMISTEMKIKYIKRMIDCGAKKMDVTSFVNPKACLLYTSENGIQKPWDVRHRFPVCCRPICPMDDCSLAVN